MKARLRFKVGDVIEPSVPFTTGVGLILEVYPGGYKIQWNDNGDYSTINTRYSVEGWYKVNTISKLKELFRDE